MRLQLERAAGKLLPPIPFAKNKAIPGLLPLTAEMCGRPSSKLTLPSNNVKSLGGATKADSSARKEEVYSPTKQLLPGRKQPVRTPNARLWPSALSPALT